MTLSDHSRTKRESNGQPGSGRKYGTLHSGLAGGVVAVLLSFLPLSELAGGGVAGYLERGAGRSGSAAGAVAGLVAGLPYLLVGLYLAATPGVTLPGPELAASRGLVIAGATGFALVLAVGLGVLGSLAGGYLRDER